MAKFERVVHAHPDWILLGGKEDDVSMGAFYFGMLPNVGHQFVHLFFSLMSLFTSICLKIFCVYTLW